MGNFWYSDFMRLLFVADGRSPIAQNWIRYFVERGDEVYLASPFVCSVSFPLAGLEITPVAFSNTQNIKKTPGRTSYLGLQLNHLATIRHFLGPLTISRSSQKLRSLINRVKPDLVHAMRIPYEGMLAADAYTGVPLLVSVWGNDFTLHAPSNRLMRHYTSWTMHVADALHADCQRDIRLGKQWGFKASLPQLVTPGNGGIRTDIFYPPSIAVEDPVVFNPRGARIYVRNDVFFKAAKLVQAKRPSTKFICAAMADEPQAKQWIQQLNLTGSVELMPPLPHSQMAEVFRRSQVVVSPSVHDGTPNSLLEGMACGCFPVAGDLESIREWITSGENGLLIDPTDPQKLASALLEAIDHKNLRMQAAGLNKKMIIERAEYSRCMAQVSGFYQSIIAMEKTGPFNANPS
jgi:glycosyltransferase involved in cell wall biosynthesis